MGLFVVVVRGAGSVNVVVVVVVVRGAGSVSVVVVCGHVCFVEIAL